VNFIEDVLERFPASKPAVVSISRQGERRVWAFGELIARSAGLSGAFAARGVRRGDVVMVLAGNRIEWVLTLLACWRMGAFALPCSTQLRRHDLELRVRAANVALCVAEEELLGELPEGVPVMTMSDIAEVMDEERPQAPPVEPVDLDPDDGALIVFTSGTTGEPRGVLHAQRYLAGQRAQAELWLGARENELVWCTTAPGWAKSARNAFVAPWVCGAAALIHDGRFDPAERLELLEREGVNVLCQAPTEYRMLAARAQLRPLAALRRMVSAGEPLNPEVMDVFRAAMELDIHDGYGQTETGQLTAMPTGEQVRPGSMGKPLPGFALEILDDGGEPATDGELCLDPATVPTFFRGYLGEEPYGEPVWRTGDRVRRDDDGFLWFEGRLDDVILSAGYRIGPFEVESALVEHPAVAEAAAVATPDAERGAVVAAVVVLRSGEVGDERLVRELQEHVKRSTAPYKYPRIVRFVDELPKTASGKIKRAELRLLNGGSETDR
jgi:acetyl-CoA synthetase